MIPIKIRWRIGQRKLRNYNIQSNVDRYGQSTAGVDGKKDVTRPKLSRHEAVYSYITVRSLSNMVGMRKSIAASESGESVWKADVAIQLEEQVGYSQHDEEKFYVKR